MPKHSIGILRTNPSGTVTAEINRQYQRIRRTFPTAAAAKRWLTTQQDTTTTPLTIAQQQDAALALTLLPPGVTLTQAARQYPRVHQVTLAQAVAAFLAEKQDTGARGRTISGYRAILTRLATALGDQHLTSLNPDHLQAALADLSGTTHNNHRRAYSTFFRWCMTRDSIQHNPAARLPRHRVDHRLPTLLTPTQVTQLLRAAPPRLIPYLAIGFFAGIRPTELTRLTHGAINYRESLITVSVAASKIRQQRHVTLLPNLKLWLQHATQATPDPQTPIAPLQHKALYGALRDLRTATDIPWEGDMMRHCFASYHLALHRNAPMTALELGHRGPNMLFQHYRGLATHADAVEYFDIVPE